VASHGTQQPLEILEAMDVRGVFNGSGASSPTSHGWSGPRGHERVGLARHARRGVLLLPQHGRLMHVGKCPAPTVLYAASVCDNVKAFHRWARRYASPASPGAVLPARTPLMRSNSGRTSTSA